MKLKNLILAALVIGAATFQSCKNAEKKEEVKEEVEVVEMEEEDEVVMDNIVTIAIENENFSTLETAVIAAGLVGTLQGEGPFTVFAPTDDAFGKLPEGTIATLLKTENKAKLVSILTYHVVAGKFMAADVIKAINDNNGMFEVTTLQGGKLVASLVDGKVMLKDDNGNMSTVIMTDVEASNGVIHAIDTVVMPK